MPVLKNKKIAIAVTIAAVLVLVLILIVALVDFGKKTEIAATHSAQASPEGFTFFNLGVDSELTDNIRDELRLKLGSDAVEKWTTLDLGINYKGFVQNYFETLDQLNQRLNFPPGERVEHNIIKLRYRYAQRKKVPFKYVELIFSNYTQKPLLFIISSNKEGAFIVDTIRAKHGEPKTINWEQEEGRSLYWEKDKAILVISISKDRYGDPEYHTIIYFVPNIETMLLKEEQEFKRREAEIKKKGKTAF